MMLFPGRGRFTSDAPYELQDDRTPFQIEADDVRRRALASEVRHRVPPPIASESQAQIDQNEWIGGLEERLNRIEEEVEDFDKSMEGVLAYISHVDDQLAIRLRAGDFVRRITRLAATRGPSPATLQLLGHLLNDPNNWNRFDQSVVPMLDRMLKSGEAAGAVELLPVLYHCMLPWEKLEFTEPALAALEAFCDEHEGWSDIRGLGVLDWRLALMLGRRAAAGVALPGAQGALKGWRQVELPPEVAEEMAELIAQIEARRAQEPS
jgi:hypothetical protein